MQEVTRDAVVSLAAFAAVFGMVYVFLMTRHRERMTILEKNLTTSPFPRTNYGASTLKYGLFLVGISIGFLLGWVLYNNCGVDEATGYLSMVCLFGGLSLIISYFILHYKKNSSAN